jgi:hypothetical protein
VGISHLAPHLSDLAGTRGRWWIWQGAGWFLLVLTLVVLMMIAPVALR